MNNLKIIFLTSFILITLIGCNNGNQNQTPLQKDKPLEAMEDIASFTGSYVSDGYQKRNEGYDWMVVLVKPSSDSSLHISVRSRIDKKKPSCTFDADAIQISEHQFRSTLNGKTIVFTFQHDSIHITTERLEDKDILKYYCTGGGTFGGTYKKIAEPLDDKQIDQRVFIKVLFIQNIGFDVSTLGKGSLQQLIIQPFGLQTDNSKIAMEIDGAVTNAEIEDLNADGFPELLVYTQSAGSGSYGNVIGYSVNAGKSVSQIYLPPVSDDPKAGKGYMGHDEFAIVETSLVRRFKTYNESDANSTPTGNIRQIQYKLKEEEATRKFVIDKIIEYPAPK